MSDTIKMRFKTNKQDGILLFADGNQGDYLTLELLDGSLWLNIDLGNYSVDVGNVFVTFE